MLYWTLVFLVIALVAGVLGFAGIAGAAESIARILHFSRVVPGIPHIWAAPTARMMILKSDD